MLIRMWDIFLSNKEMFIAGVITTLKLAIVGTSLGLLIGLIVGILRTVPKSKNKFKNGIIHIVNLILNIYVTFFRGTPMMVQAMVFYFGIKQFYGISLSALNAGYIIISINTGAYLSEVVRGGINSIDQGQYEGAKAIGMSHFETMRYVILPQVIKNILPSVGNELIINIKDSSVLNVISITELFFVSKSIAAASFKIYESYFITCIIYLILTIGVTKLLHFVELRLSNERNTNMQNQMQI